MSRRIYTVACLAGDGVGPELMAEASRALTQGSRLHGFEVDDVHVPFGTEAFSRSGHHLPPATRAACLDADAVLVALAGEPVLAEIESELDLRAAVTRVRYGDHKDLRLIHPLGADATEWAVERAFTIARASKATLASVDEDGRFGALVEDVARRNDGVDVEHLTMSAGMPALAFHPERFDVVVTGPTFGGALAEIASGLDRQPHVVACGRLAANGPGVFGPPEESSQDLAGAGVADPSAMLLAVSTMLDHGLGEHGAAQTLATAVTDAWGGMVRGLLRGVATTTRQFADTVLAGLPTSHSAAEFARELRS